MKKLIYLVAFVFLLAAACKNEEIPVVKKDLLIGTTWEKKSAFYNQKLKFIDGYKIEYYLNSIKNGVEEADLTPEILSYNISSGAPLVDNEAILIISSSSYYYDGYKISIYKDFLLWETRSPYDSSTYKDTFKKAS